MAVKNIRIAQFHDQMQHLVFQLELPGCDVVHLNLVVICLGTHCRH